MTAIKNSDILAIGDESSERRDVLSVLWAITKGCNFKCSYCVYNKDLRTTEFSSKSQLLGAARTLERLGRPGYQITLYGGEPTQHPHFLDLLAYFVDSAAPVSLRMFTNASQTAAFFKKMTETAKGYYFGNIFSFHPDFAKFEKYKRNLEIVAAAGMSVAVSFTFVAKRREEARRQIDELWELRAKLPFYFQVIHPYTVKGAMGDGCTAADISWLKSAQKAFEELPMPDSLRTPFYTRIKSRVTIAGRNGPKQLREAESLQLLTRMQMPVYTGYHCCSGTNVLFIEEDGIVRGGVCGASAEIGDIFRDSEIKLIQAMQPVRCAASACSSIENIPLPKFRDAAEAEKCTTAFRERAKRHFYMAEAARLERAREPA